MKGKLFLNCVLLKLKLTKMMLWYDTDFFISKA